MSRAHMERGDVLFHEGDRGDTLYVIAEGKIKLGRTSPDGRENLVAILGPGEMFGELSLFDPGPRTMTATAVAETQLLGLRNESLTAVLSGRPEVSKTLLAALAQRLRRTNAHLADLVFTDVPGRVAKALLDLSERFGRPVEGGIMVSHDLTQEELAQLVGARPTGRSLPRDGQQGPRRLRHPRLAPTRGPGRAVAGCRTPQAPRPLTLRLLTLRLLNHPRPTGPPEGAVNSVTATM